MTTNYDEDGSEEQPKSSFAIYMAEGDVLFKQGEFRKANESYSQALEIEPSDKGCLVARARCFLQLGDSQAALKDAESSLLEDKEYSKGLYQKAEALYQMGDFEYALMFYHRGHKLRPELDEFRLGIQKAQEAIDNSVGSPSKVKLENKGDLSYFYKQEEKQGKGKKMGYSKQIAKQQEKKDRQRMKSASSDKTCKQLLGELYADKEYLEKLLKDTDLTKRNTESGQRIYQLVNEGLDFLDTRTDFWRQQKPMYARKRDKEDAQRRRSNKKSVPSDPTKYILRNLEEIDNYLAEENPRDALRHAEQTLRTVEKWSDEDIPDKADVVSNLHSCIGNAFLDLDKPDQALEHHKQDLTIAEDNKLDDAKSRALDNLGRVYARTGKFQQAVDNWERKLPMSKSALESTWLYHEIGRCYLELGGHETARDYGEKSIAAAQEANDNVWQLNACVLISQSEVKLGNLQAAIEGFERALDMAKAQGDSAAEQAISKAMEDVNERIVRGIKDDKDREEPGQQEGGQESGDREPQPAEEEAYKTDDSTAEKQDEEKSEKQQAEESDEKPPETETATEEEPVEEETAQETEQ